jgi:hypothetical protein
MKKIIIVILLLTGLQASSQVILQNVVSEFNGTVNICADTIEHEDYTCQISEEIDSIALCPEYTAFVKMCNSLTGNITTSFVCQLTVKQTLPPFICARIIIRYKEQPLQSIIYYDDMSLVNKAKFNDFVNKCKNQLYENSN